MKSLKTVRGFTLIELLTVIAIIAILVGLLFPTIQSAIKKAEIGQARGDIKAIEGAIRAYMNEYGKLPVSNALQGGSDDACYFFTSPGQATLMNVLRGKDSTLNPRAIVFLETPARKGAVDASGNFIDPWGQRYAIKLDCNYDNVVNYYGNQSGPAVVISYGPNRTQEDPNSSGSDDLVNYK